ncbi:BTB/POZ domain-containing protein 17 [Orycteropus afer afer]|uniref:BTB/POZ domain-containing protein 17 n=1 Tax=Orycteropus afer afer TaxID=1230840 RepID=A0A8B7BDJ4_ORYAF|nr:BTB/POZ domain-containing protein 17 [Orycteropus afer afer]
MPREGCAMPGSWGSFWAILTLVGLATRTAQRADGGGEAAGPSINHSPMLLQRLQELLRQGNASDVVLRVQATGTEEVRIFHTHRLLLGLHSELFRELLQNQSEVVLPESRDCAAVFDKFIRYLYCGELTLLLAQAIPLHKLATKYGVASLQRGVAEYMRAHLAGGAGPAVGWYHYAVSTGDEALRASCLQFLAWNLSAVAGSAEWGVVSPELLAQLLQRSDLVLQDELELFHALEAWLGRARPPSAVAERALRAIRYPMIPPAQLFQLQARSADGRPRLVVTPASSGGDAAGVSFQKTVLVVGARHQGRLLVRHAYNFHQSSEEAGDFLAHADLQRRNSEYLVENALHLHLIVKPVYHTLIRTPSSPAGGGDAFG